MYHHNNYEFNILLMLYFSYQKVSFEKFDFRTSYGFFVRDTIYRLDQWAGGLYIECAVIQIISLYPSHFTHNYNHEKLSNFSHNLTEQVLHGTAKYFIYKKFKN